MLLIMKETPFFVAVKAATGMDVVSDEIKDAFEGAPTRVRILFSRSLDNDQDQPQHEMSVTLENIEMKSLPKFSVASQPCARYSNPPNYRHPSTNMKITFTSGWSP